MSSGWSGLARYRMSAGKTWLSLVSVVFGAPLAVVVSKTACVLNVLVVVAARPGALTVVVWAPAGLGCREGAATLAVFCSALAAKAMVMTAQAIKLFDIVGLGVERQSIVGAALSGTVSPGHSFARAHTRWAPIRIPESKRS